jgi:hypothetical protein
VVEGKLVMTLLIVAVVEEATYSFHS